MTLETPPSRVDARLKWTLPRPSLLISYVSIRSSPNVLSDTNFSSTEDEIALKNSSRVMVLEGGTATQCGLFPLTQIHVDTKKPFALHLDLDTVNFGLTAGLGGRVSQLFSRAMASTFAKSSMAGRQVLSANSAADFGSARAAAL